MAKQSMLQKELKRQKLITKYKKKRIDLLLKFKNSKIMSERDFLSIKIQKLPKNSSPTRLRNRCWKTGKSRGYFRFFGLCRNSIRELSLQCYLPGIIKSSW